MSVYCALVSDPTGATPNLKFARYASSSEAATGDYVPHDLIAVGPNLVFVMSSRADDTPSEARNARNLLRDGVNSVYRLHIASVLDLPSSANTNRKVEPRVPTLIRQTTSNGSPFMLPVLPADTTHEKASVVQRSRDDFVYQFVEHAWQADRLLASTSSIVTGTDPWGKKMHEGTGMGGGLVFTGLVDQSTEGSTLIRPALLFWTGELSLEQDAAL